MKKFKFGKAKTRKQYIDEVINRMGYDMVELTSNYMTLHNVNTRKYEIQSLVFLMDCEVSGFEITKNGEFETKFTKDGVFEDKGIYCPTDMYIPSGEYEQRTYSDTNLFLSFDKLEIKF